MSLVWSFFLQEQPVLVSPKLRNVSLEKKKEAILVSLCVYSSLPVHVENMLLFQAWWWSLLVCLFPPDSPNSAIELRKLEQNCYKLYQKLAWNYNNTLFWGPRSAKWKSIWDKQVNTRSLKTIPNLYIYSTFTHRKHSDAKSAIFHLQSHIKKIL